MSDSNAIQLSMAKETTFGEVITTLPLQILRMTSESLGQENTNQTSNEIRSDRQTSNVKRTGISAAGNIEIELSYGSFDDLMKAALMSSGWANPGHSISASSIAADSSANSFTDSGDNFEFEVGNWIKVTGFSNSSLNGIYKVTSASSDTIVVWPNFDEDEDAGASVTITTGDTITNGKEEYSFNIEKYFTDLTDTYALLLGMEVDTFDLSLEVDQMITGTFGFTGSKEVTPSPTISQGSGYTPANTNEQFATAEEVIGIYENGVLSGTTTLTLSTSNNLAGRKEIGGSGVTSIRKGSFNVTGTYQKYFSNSTLCDKFLSSTPSSLAFVLNDSVGNMYVFDIPRLKFTSSKRVAGGKDDDIIADMEWEAYMHETENVTMIVTRFPIS